MVNIWELFVTHTSPVHLAYIMLAHSNIKCRPSEYGSNQNAKMKKYTFPEIFRGGKGRSYNTERDPARKI